MQDIGKLLVVAGLVIVGVGLLVIASGRLHLPLGHLPGDIVVRRKNYAFYFPLVTCIVLSVLLTLVFYLFGKFTR